MKPDSVITWFQGLDVRSAANLLFGLYAMTSGAVAKVAYQASQPPFAAPWRPVLASVLALMKTSACLTLPLISLTSCVEPPARVVRYSGRYAIVANW